MCIHFRVFKTLYHENLIPVFTLCAIFLVFFLFDIATAKGQNIGISSDGASPDTSAMLDIVSSNKGLLMPRVALASTTDATTIPTPATSLLVYNNNAGIAGTGAAGTGFYYNSGTTGSPVWTKLVTDAAPWKTTGNSGTDSANNFIGTTDGKRLLFKTNNIRRLNISSAGVTTLGDGTNQVKIDSAGHFSLEGAASNYNDIVVPPFSTYLSGANGPLFTALKNNGSGSIGVQTFTFQDMGASSEQQVYFSIQMPHSWKEGTTIYPHIHWSPQSNTGGSVVWGFEYSWVDYNSTTPVAFPNSTIITATSSAVTSSDVDKHLITAFNSILPSATQGKISSIMMCRLFRNSSNPQDTYNGGNAALLSFDVHYEIDALGSNSQYGK